MGDLWRPATIKEVLGRHGFRFSKALGQNFLIDPRVCPRMAAESGAAECAGAIEVGPGLGVLTYELAQVAKKVVAIELDQRLFPVLGETLADCPNVELVQGDVLKLDLHALIQEKFGGQEVCVCANLPYYITSPVIMGLLEGGLPLKSITVMVQKEAAERICAQPGQRACGAVSVSVHYHSQPQVLFGVSRGSFLPPPNVDSAVIRLDLRREPPVQVADEGWFFRVSRAAFAQRRKTAANSISASLELPKAQVEAALGAAGIPANARAEQLSLEQFAALANALPPLAKPGEDRV
ncbi:MAG TPA: 16S rRNA (adenine(1518)-N(6)/adenine(1519)-N(6))-dimethyltransferase RsmA [Candidatus Acutalibacter stercorigallinarum]|nr:16S rRNA (adenine(1518)-N(6)/adenine(1519)-N(6))-dimethyltransferase RsmA [Candidatus Acutalibacter stercorigallinarum]